MADKARHQARREQLAILYGDPLQDSEKQIEPSALHTITLMMSMAYTLDQCEGTAAGQLEHAQALGLQLLLEGGESPVEAQAMLEAATNAIQAEARKHAATPADPLACQAWLALLEEEVDYIRTLMRA
ncbi:MAG: hypothetical protein ABN482_12840 [Corticimicrobacter sp.]|uniref:hypothetical protein n=1 Tax=Corticimicrobacter sp. TaxID=2678536 RepID=UPI0032DAAEF5